MGVRNAWPFFDEQARLVPGLMHATRSYAEAGQVIRDLTLDSFHHRYLIDVQGLFLGSYRRNVDTNCNPPLPASPRLPEAPGCRWT